MSAGICDHCGKACATYTNYCDWNCHVGNAKALGGKVICPNGMPVACIRHDGAMLEHPHANHPDYKFPVVANHIGEQEKLPEWDTSYEPQTHALIYTDGTVALTLYECTYCIFRLSDGTSIAGHMWKKGEWKLDELSLQHARVLKPWPEI